jgi:YjbE family integral membrane protein
MEWFTGDWFIALMTIVVIDLVLAGDNAILIGLAARNLEKKQQKKVIWWGTAGAIIIRVVATFVVVWLLKIPGLMIAGGLILIWIAYKLLVDNKDHGEVKAAPSLWAAIRTIIIADAVMGLDNVLAIAGASHGSMELVIIGLLISVPIVVWGSMLIIQLIDRFPWILYIGSGVLAYTAAKMIVGEKFMHFLFENNLVKYGFEVLVVIIVVGSGYLVNKMHKKNVPAS